MKQEFTGKSISRAGENLLDPDILKDKEKFSESMNILSAWRFSHTVPLEEAFSYLQEVTLKKDKKALFAKRLKRHISIVGKLQRFKKMKLKNMQDIGGCRVILSTDKKLRQVERELRRSSYFKSKTGKVRSKDYINNAKSDGYRSLHIIGKFPCVAGKQKNIEIQLRTFIQHYWATAVEIVDLFTDQALKSNEGDDEWKVFFIRVSEQFAIMDNIHLFSQLSEKGKHEKYQQLVKENKQFDNSCKTAQKYCEKLDVFNKLNAFAGSLEHIDEKINQNSSENIGYVLLIIDTQESLLTSKVFDSNNSKSAEKEYLEAEKKASKEDNLVVALVSTTAVGSIKEAYPNFFADSSKFMEHLNLIMSVYYPNTVSVYNQLDILSSNLIEVVRKNKIKDE